MIKQESKEEKKRKGKLSGKKESGGEKKRKKGPNVVIEPATFYSAAHVTTIELRSNYHLPIQFQNRFS